MRKSTQFQHRIRDHESDTRQEQIENEKNRQCAIPLLPRLPDDTWIRIFQILCDSVIEIESDEHETHRDCPNDGVKILAYTKRDTAALVPVMQVCKRFHDLAAPTLYKHAVGASIDHFFHGIDHASADGRLSKLDKLALVETLELVYPSAFMKKQERGRLRTSTIFRPTGGTSTHASYVYTPKPGCYTSKSAVRILSSFRALHSFNRITPLPRLQTLQLSEIFPCQPLHGSCDHYYKVGSSLSWSTGQTSFNPPMTPDGVTIPVQPSLEIGPYNCLAPDLAFELCQLHSPHHVCRHRKWNDIVYKATSVPPNEERPLTYAALILGWDIDDSLPLPLMRGVTSVLLADYRHLNPYITGHWPRYGIACNMLQKLRKSLENSVSSSSMGSEEAGKIRDLGHSDSKVILRLPLNTEDLRKALRLLRPLEGNMASSSTQQITNIVSEYLTGARGWGTKGEDIVRFEVQLVEEPTACPVCRDCWVEDQFGKANHS
ncbi:hypothetical protein IAT40_007241 [Kwoniella sp. CBS 6097]